MNRDGNQKSIWQNIETLVEVETNKKEFDVAIIGGGITGITCAYNLQQSGLQCIVLEAANIAFGTTGGTTAHLNNFFDTPYHQVVKDFGEKDAKLFAQSGMEAMAFIKNVIAKHDIDCDYAERTGYVFATEAKQLEALQQMVDSCNDVALPMQFINDSPFAIPYLKIASIDAQAEFHPVKYIKALANEFIKSGGVIQQNCRVKNISGTDALTIETENGNYEAKSAVYATHIPPGVNVLHFECAPYRSYAIAVQLKDLKYPEALGYDMEDPYHYFRSHTIDGKKYLIVGGEDHKTGHEENTQQCFRKLESYTRKFYDVASVDFTWSSQYYVPADGLPYIGHLPGNPDNIYCATGYNGNGMTLGTIAGIIISDLIVHGDNKYKKLFSPSRIKPVAAFENILKESADVISDFIGDKFSVEKMESFSELAPREAKVVKYDGKTIAAYKDEHHQLHLVNAACTHIKCNVAWNNAEQSWDCPCHGSRFDFNGNVLTAPARKNLGKIG